MSESISPQPIAQERLTGQKILRIPKGYREANLADAFSPSGAHDSRKAVIRAFASHGFEVVEEGEFNRDNTLEIAISGSSRRRDREIADRVGIEMPQVFEPDSILTYDKPLVAKMNEADRGQEKYLLETADQKAKFLTWMLTAHNLTSLTTTEEREAWIQSVLDKVKHGDFTDPRFPVDDLRHKEWIDFWKFEEFIESPGEYSTSIRVVADCFGEVHYGELISSQEKKGAEQLPIPLIPGEHPLENLYGMPLNVLLLHPDSPLYIAPKKFVSNIASGGRSLLLNGVPATDDISRQMCQDLGIDPDHPQIPSALESISKEIGKEARDMYPYVGSDFMISDRNNQGVLLEINAGPGLSPEALGFPADTSKSQLREALINKILKKVA